MTPLRIFSELLGCIFRLLARLSSLSKPGQICLLNMLYITRHRLRPSVGFSVQHWLWSIHASVWSADICAGYENRVQGRRLAGLGDVRPRLEIEPGQGSGGDGYKIYDPQDV
ncbi:hypothetical protein F5Y09DRAFT_302962, partial [Xylaria sp. FL1042]